MSQQFVPPPAGRLIDGRELRVTSDGVQVDERNHPLARIQEASLLFLRPETIALRLADIGQVEYSFARQGDGAAALEALYQLRPDLRRADAPAPAPEAPPNYFAPVVAPPPPLPLAPPAPGAPYGAPRSPYSMTPPSSQAMGPMGPVPFPPQTLEAYGPAPNRAYAELTPIPRTSGQLIGNTFRLFGKRLGALLALALVVTTLPSMVTALLDALVSAMGGINPLAGAPNPLDALQQVASGQTATATATTPSGSTTLDAILSVLSLTSIVLSLLVAAWSQASLTVGAREAALGRPISVKACAREGLARLWPTLGALFFLYGALAVIAIPGFGLALAFVVGPSDPSVAGQFSGQDATAFAVIAGVVAGVTLMIVAYLWSRFALYPTAAALGAPQPLRQSLSLTSFGWRRVFVALLVVTLATGVLTISASAAQLYSVALAAVVLAPLTQLITGPLGALIRVGALYDQRLRREGYALFQQEGVAIPTATSPRSGAAPTAESGEPLR